MSEYELDLLRQRSLEARWAKAKRGELVVQAPVGFLKTADQRIEKDPDRRVQQAIALVFAKFLELGSARQVALWFIEHAVEMPTKRWGPKGCETWWRRPAYRNVISMLKEPTYAGAYAYGRTVSLKRVVDGALQKTISRKPLEEWKVLIPEHHEGYVSWDEFTRIQKMLSDNACGFQVDQSPGAPKKGPALLAGLLRCRRCGRKLMVGYSGRNAVVPRYACARGRLDNMEAKCITFGGLSVDAAVSKEILRVVLPGAVEVAALVVAQETDRRDDLVETLLLALKAARYEADLARRQYDTVDPGNRLVAAELERRWNVALERVRELEVKTEQEQRRVHPRRPDPKPLKNLGADLVRVWSSGDTDLRLKKRILRTLVQEIVVDIDVARSEVELVLHWKGGMHSVLRIARRRRGTSSAHTNAGVVEAIRQLALVCSDRLIAAYLNRNTVLTARGNRWSCMAVASSRNKRGIPVHAAERQRSEGWLNLTEAAAHLGVTPKTTRRAAECGELKGMHPLPDGPWVFKGTDLDDPGFRERVGKVRNRNSPPAGPDTRQLDLTFSTTYRGEAL